VVELGRLEVMGMSTTSAANERRLIFDPTNRTGSLSLSDPAGSVGRLCHVLRSTQHGRVKGSMSTIKVASTGLADVTLTVFEGSGG